MPVATILLRRSEEHEGYASIPFSFAIVTMNGTFIMQSLQITQSICGLNESESNLSSIN